jgi:hypothetical protein
MVYTVKSAVENSASMQKVEHHLYRLQAQGYWLLLQGGIVQSVSCIAAILWSVLLPMCVLILRYSPTRALWQMPAETPSSEAGRNLARSVRRDF